MTVKQRSKKNWSFGYSFRDFLERLKHYGLPSSRRSVLYWEEKGWVTFRRSPGGYRVFASIDEIDDVIKALAKNREMKLERKRIIKQDDFEDDDSFGIK